MPTLAFLLALAPFLSFLFYLGFLQRRVITNREVVPNSRGLPVLPDELYSEILSHWQAIPIPQSAYLNVPIDSRRHVTLLALSQTCRSLRSFFLQYAWERIEVFEGMWTPTGRLATEIELLRHASSADVKKKPLHAKFAKEIRRQFETVTVRNPELGQYVRYAYSSFFSSLDLNISMHFCSFVNILFVNSSHWTIMLPQLAKILSLLPRVHTLQINPPEYHPFLTGVNFSRYPQIQTLCIRGSSIMCDEIFLACPNLTSFTQYDHGIIFLETLLRSCSSNLHTLGILSYEFPLLGFNAFVLVL